MSNMFSNPPIGKFGTTKPANPLSNMKAQSLVKPAPTATNDLSKIKVSVTKTTFTR